MNSKHKILFTPFKIGNVEIKNRFVMAPMGTGMCTHEGAFTERAADFYAERAKGGTGLIITGCACVENEIERFKDGAMQCPTISVGAFIKTATLITERIHAFGAKIFLQLTAGFGRVVSPAILNGDAVSASFVSNFWDEKLNCRELTVQEIENIVKKSGEASEIARITGFDGVEIHAVHEGYLLDQFALSLFNKRKDHFGGSLENRLRFASEIVQEIKKKAGSDYPVTLRYSLKSCIKNIRKGGLPGEEYKELGRDISEGMEAAKILEKAGYDGFDVDAGTYDSWYWSHPPMYQKKGLYLDYAEILKKNIDSPVIAAGRMEDPDLAAASIIDGRTDMVAIGRGLLADAHIPLKIRTGQSDRIRPCLGCHQGCMERLVTAKVLSCAVNPVAGRENTYSLTPAMEKKKILIVGAGIAGMEFARVSTLRGHHIEIYEKSDRAGGCLIPGGSPSFKEDDRRLVKWYEKELDKLDIKIKYSSEVGKADLEQSDCDVIVIATGGKPANIRIKGDEEKNILQAVDVLNGKNTGDKVLIIGGGLVGCELALYLTEKGKTVIIAETLSDILIGTGAIPYMNRIMLKDLLAFKHVTVFTDTNVVEVGKNFAVLEKSGKKEKIEVTDVISAAGFRADKFLYEKLINTGKESYIIGDAREVKNIMTAIWDAYEVARMI